MVQKTVVTILDDIDGTKAEGTVRFSFDGKTYEVDLSKKNQAAMRKALKPYLDAAREVRISRSRPGGRRAASGNSRTHRATDLATIRAWARDNGYEVSDRGRIAASVVDAYNAAAS